MVLGIRSKSRKNAAVKVEYSIHVKEIRPWPPSDSLKSAQSVLLQWENGDESYGSLTSSVADGRIEFNESFRLPVTLNRLSSRKSSGPDSFQKNYLQFNLYEARKDKAVKGQLLGSAVINLADYGVIKEIVSLKCPITFKRSSRNAVQSVLFVSIQPFDEHISSSSTPNSLSKQASLDKDETESVYESINDEEAEIASFTDDEDDDVSSHSSRATSSSAVEPSGDFPSKDGRVGSRSGNGSFRRVETTQSSAGMHTNSMENSVVEGIGHVNGSSAPSTVKDGIGRVGTTLPSDGLHSNFGVDSVGKELRHVNGRSSRFPATDSIRMDETSLTSATLPSKLGVNSAVQGSRRMNESSTSLPAENGVKRAENNLTSAGLHLNLGVNSDVEVLGRVNASSEMLSSKEDGKDSEYAENNKNESLTQNLPDKAREEKEQQENGDDTRVIGAKKHPPEDTRTIDAMRKQVSLRNDRLALSRVVHNVQGTSTASNGVKDAKSVQFNFDSSNSNGLLKNSHIMPKANDIPDVAKCDKLINGEGTAYRFSSDSAELESKIEIVENSHIMPKENDIPDVAKHDKLINGEGTAHGFVSDRADLESKTEMLGNSHVMPKANDIPDVAKSDKLINGEGTAPSFSSERAELESKIEMLEEELREAAAVEASLYSVIAEHGSSMNKVHAPARRLSRFYLHASKASSQATRANAARTVLSGLVLVSKACGNDVPRLSFWLSNSIVLRVIVSLAIRDSKNKVSEPTSPQDKEECNSVESFDDFEDPKAFLVALEKLEAWIFSRIVESVWWQTLTPHMQSAAAKGSILRKTSTMKNGLRGQEQGNFSIELWKKAFKDACERLCPLRAGGHECGCLHMLSKLVMEQLVGRLDVAMFNAILRESAEEMPTDPVSDPISDPNVLPIPAGKSSFGAGVQLKNAIGTWSRWLTDLFGIDDDNDCPESDNEYDDDKNSGSNTPFKPFCLLNALSDLMMLPSEMLVDSSTRKELCPKFNAPLIRRVLECFVPDEFSPSPVPDTVFKALDEDFSEPGEESISNFPCTAAPTAYSPPTAASLAGTIGEISSQALQRSKSSVLKKSYTSDDELDELDSPLSLFMTNNFLASPTTKGRKVVRYQLLRDVWKSGED